MITKENLTKANTNLKYVDIERYDKKIGAKVTKKYVTVPSRVQAFRNICPAGTIDTTVCDYSDDSVLIQAKIYDEGDHLLASGTARERREDSSINETSYIENCETSAVGRALGMLGIGSEESMASAEEMAAALLNQVEIPPGKRILREYCDEHARTLKDVWEEHGLNKNSENWAFYSVLAELMKEDEHAKEK